MTKIWRAYKAISRAYLMHLPPPEWAIDILEDKETLKLDQEMANRRKRGL